MNFNLQFGLGGNKGTAVAASAYLDGVIDSVCCDLDATISASYGGSGQTWANLITSPADGAAQTDYDFFLGADGTSSTDDPTFTGTAGDAAAYFSLDGGDLFRIPANTSLLTSMHKTTGGSDFWIALSFKYVANAGVQIFFATNTTATADGVRILTSANSLIIQQRGSATVNLIPGVTLVDGTDYILIVSHSHAGDTTRYALNSTTMTEGAHVFSTTTTDATAQATIAAAGNDAANMVNGTRIYGFDLGNEYLDDTKAAAIIAHLEARHGRDYTP